MLSQTKREFVEFARPDQNAATASGEFPDQFVNLRLGRDVHALRRFFKQQHADFAREPFRKNDFLLIAAGQGRHRQARVARADVERFHQFCHQPVAARAVEARARPAHQPVEARKQNVVADRQIHHEAEAAFAGHESDPEPDGRRRACDAPRRALAADFARVAGDAEQPAQHAARAAAQKPGKPGHLVRMKPDRIRAFGCVFEQHRAGGGFLRIDRRRRASGHGRDQAGDVEVAAPARGRHAAVAQHRAAVGESDHLVEPVRDIDDGGALAFHPRQHREQAVDLARFERRGRLVENKHAALTPERPRDGDKLPFGKTQPVHADVGRRGKIEQRKLLARLFAHFRAVDNGKAESPAQRRIAERQIFGDRQGRDQPQFLRNGDDACGNGVARPAEVPDFAADRDLAPVGPMHAAKNAHQRRFSRAVLADERVHLARQHVERDAIERPRRAELFADVAGAGRRKGHARDSPEPNGRRARRASSRR